MKRESRNPLHSIEIDAEWHGRLIDGNDNEQLARILVELKRIIFRYEYALMRVPDLVAGSAADHSAVVEALARGDRANAIRLLSTHWERCANATLSEIAKRGSSEG